jgi:hypothetical protein
MTLLSYAIDVLLFCIIWALLIAANGTDGDGDMFE